MKLILEFRSMEEMRAFCREQMSQEVVAPQREVPVNGSSDAPVLEVPEDQESITGLGKRQVAVLRALADGAHRPTKWISEEIGLAVPALSTTLTSLAKRGLVNRVKWGTWAKADGAPGVPEAPEPVVEPEVVETPPVEVGVTPPPPKPKRKAKAKPKPKAKEKEKEKEKTEPPTTPFPPWTGYEGEEQVFSTVDQILGDI